VADAKGQLLLTLNGIYITVLSSIVLVSPQDLVNRKTSLQPVTWLFLSGACYPLPFTRDTIVPTLSCKT
jgi:hypothetical protein